MFTLLDGRASAFQWDTGLHVDCTGLKEGDEVHFCRPGTILAILPTLVNGSLAAPVPDEMLQTADTIVIFAYTETETGGITRVEKRLGVTSRPKPPTYVYTPAEALRYKTLEERIEKLEETGEYYIPAAEQNGKQLVLTYTPSQPTLPALDPVTVIFPDDEAAAAHIAAGNNPHGVTAAQVGAVSSAVFEQSRSALQEQIGTLSDTLSDHRGDYGNPHKVTAVQTGAAPATESTAYTGCYYRTVNGEREWLNPPTAMGVEYRTTERWNGHPVYTMLLDCGTIGLGADVYISIPDTSANVFDLDWQLKDTENASLFSDHPDIVVLFVSGPRRVRIVNNSEAWTGQMTVRIKYWKGDFLAE